jgi:hypothetical protein
MSFRFLNQSPVYLDNSGIPLAGGSLTFSNTGTSTPKTVYSDKALSVSLGSTVTLDSSGRAPTDIWGSGSYRVVLKNSVGTTIKTLDDVDELLSGSGIPSQGGNSGKYLTTDGSNTSWGAISQVPTQTGNAGKYLRTDGTTASWASPTLVPIVSTAASASTLTPDAGYDAYHFTALAANITIANPTGTWADGQGCVVRIKDNGTPRTISFGANYVAFDAALPTTTIASKEIYIPFIYNAATAKWNVIRPSKQV